MRMYDIQVYENEDGEIVLLQDEGQPDESLVLLSKGQAAVVAREMLKLCGQWSLNDGQVSKD